MLRERGLMMKQGTMVDATIIAAPRSTQNRTGERDPEMVKSPLGGILDQLERALARIRAKGEHAFRVIQRPFGDGRIKYRGLAQNTANLMTLFALANLWNPSQ